MSDWSSGYNVERGYTFKYYKEMAPHWLDFVASLNGLQPPSHRHSGSGWRYLELGCGQGAGLVILAASHPEHQFLGIDFNPEHIAHARGLAQAAGLENVSFEEADFLALGEAWPSAWGQFDYLAAHGIYSWLSPTVRQQLVKTIDQASAPGALVYLSYNSHPGWLSALPVQHLLRLWQETEALDSPPAMATGLARLKQLEKMNVLMMQALPKMREHLSRMEGKEPA